MKSANKIIRLFILGAAWVAIAYTYPTLKAIDEFASLAVAEVFVGVGLTCFVLFDLLGVREFDLFEEIKKGNVAAGLYLIGFCLLFGLCLLAAR